MLCYDFRTWEMDNILCLIIDLWAARGKIYIHESYVVVFVFAESPFELDSKKSGT